MTTVFCRADSFCVRLLRKGNNLLQLTCGGGMLTLDRRNCEVAIEGEEPLQGVRSIPFDGGVLEAEILLDECCAEVFAGGSAMSMLAYNDGDGITFCADGTVRLWVTLWDVEV